MSAIAEALPALSPFAEAAPLLYEQGYSPIPIMPGSKAPGEYDAYRRRWRLRWDWQKLCTSRAHHKTVAHWATCPDAGIGVACGFGGLICVDIDFEPAMIALLNILPECNVQKIGRKGVSLFYKGDASKIKSRGFRTIERVGLVDLLSAGKQTVLPPTPHRDTGHPYFWNRDETLLDTSVGGLAVLPDDIAERIAEVLRPFGYDPDGECEQERVARGGGGAAITSESVYRQANDLALLHLDGWVPELRLCKCRRKPGGYHAVASWRPSSTGRALERRARNLSIVREGITDFGDGPKTYTAVDLAMAALECSKGRALNWLLERLPQEPVINLRSARHEV